MSDNISIIDINPTVFIKKASGMLKQLINVKIKNGTSKPISGELRIELNGNELHQDLQLIENDESNVDVYIPCPKDDTPITVSILVNNSLVTSIQTTVSPPRHWTVHVIQLSHHDLGYTGLPSNVLSKQARYLDRAIDMAEATEAYPDDSRFRILLEQAWSVDYFLNNATSERAEKLIRLMQSGQFELTALFGNMITELCGHESLIRALYPSFRLKKKYNIPIVSAEHNDIPGISWGLCRLLTDAGVKIFCPGLPLYYNWSDPPYQSFWDQQAVFGNGESGIPGAFWWEAVTGKKIVFWCNNKGCGGSANLELPGLIETLDNINHSDYPGSVLRWPVHGGGRDNSPYIIGFTEMIKEWNETWAFPKLICSTNAKFYEDFCRENLSELPVHRGELPGQDYPSGAMSTAKTTSLNRNNHHSITSAEKLAVISTCVTDYQHQTYELENARKNTLYFEEHAWGHAYSHGPAMDGAESEKAVFACRATAYAHDVKQKALAKIADNINKGNEDIHLVVFNTLGFKRTSVIRAPLRELENCEIIMEDKNGILVNSALQGRAERTHLILPDELLDGNFELYDTESSEKVDFQLLEISPQDADVFYASQRAGLAQGREEYFNKCKGWNYDLCFIAKDVPPLGYKSYRLKPVTDSKSEQPSPLPSDGFIENEFYRINVDRNKGRITSIYDKDQQLELIDSDAPHDFGEIIVRSPVFPHVENMLSTGEPIIKQGQSLSSITTSHTIHGHPVIRQTVLLYTGIKKIDFAVRILKDSTPLLDVHITFPFAITEPRFIYEGTLNVLEPVKDFLPGAYSDTLTVQNWVEAGNDDYKLIWSSHDSPLVSLSELWPGYVSPAHSCVLAERLRHSPQKENDFKHGWIYSNIFNNNFCTNFSVSQNGECTFRYSISTVAGALSTSQAISSGLEHSIPLEYIYSSQNDQGELPLNKNFIEINNNDVILLNCKLADDGQGIIMRFWNPTNEKISSRINCFFTEINSVFEVNPAEEKTECCFKHDNTGFQFEIDSFSVLTVLLNPGSA